jgi:hypothetical protein
MLDLHSRLTIVLRPAGKSAKESNMDHKGQNDVTLRRDPQIRFRVRVSRAESITELSAAEA